MRKWIKREKEETESEKGEEEKKIELASNSKE